jgi:hypothetical protein
MHRQVKFRKWVFAQRDYNLSGETPGGESELAQLCSPLGSPASG